MKAKCFRCGSELESTARFCPNCGTPVSDPQSATVVLPSEAGDDLLQRLRLVLAGEYEVEQELARGGMAIVYRATEVGLGRVVALKVLPPDLGLTPRAVERFKREARMVAELDHPNIIPVFRVGQSGTILYIVMKFVEGLALDAILEAQGALPVHTVLYVLRGATRALAYAHECGIVHRDIKGGNLLVDRDGRVLVSDFGVALRAADITLTVDGAVIGTPPFMSPEQCAGRRAGPQSDQYSLGIVAFQMLTGSVPFHADSLAGIMQHHFFTPVPDIGLVRDDAPEALTRILRRVLSKEAADRFPTTGEMLAAIEAIPFSDADRRESERILQQLTQGDAVARVSTRSLPALPETPTLAMNLRRAPRSRGYRLIVRGGGLAAAGLLAGAAVLWVGRASHRRGAMDPETVHPSPPPAPPAALGPSPQQAPSSRAAPGGSGRLRMLTSPPDAEISVDSRRVGVGAVFDVAITAGARRLRVRAPGYETFDTTIVIPAGGTVSLGRVALRTRGGGT